jgi:hypothetical protein
VKVVTASLMRESAALDRYGLPRFHWGLAFTEAAEISVRVS